MDSKKIAYILMTFSFVLIVSGSVSLFLIGLKNDRNETYKRMDDVSNSYEVFSTNVSVFENVRDELYNNILGNVYYDTMYTNDLVIKNKPAIITKEIEIKIPFFFIYYFPPLLSSYLAYGLLCGSTPYLNK